MTKGIKGFIIGVASTCGLFIILAAGNKDFIISKCMEVYFSVFKDVNMLYVDDTDPDKLMETGLKSMLNTLDPYTEFMNKQENEVFMISSSGKYGGVGAQIIKLTDQYPEISDIYENCSAHKMGLFKGDKLISIDGFDLKNLSPEQVSSKLKGDPGTHFKLKYIPLRDSSIIKEINFKREIVNIPAVNYSGFISEGIGYIELSTFSENASSEVKRALEDLNKNGKLKKLILDLRSNGGGIMDEAVKIISLFVPKSTEVVSMKGRIYPKPLIYKTKSEPIAPDLPLFIITDGNSASASEIVAGALQDLDRAVIVGDKTFGKGLVQTTRDVGNGASLKITTAKYYTPSGRCIQAVDFSNRKEDGSVGNIPDSLKHEYKTKKGRIVYDGGGIDPDIKYKRKYSYDFTNYVLNSQHLDNYVKEYLRTYLEPVDIDKFAIDDIALDKFCNILEDSLYAYKSRTELILQRVEKNAKEDGYFSLIEDDILSIQTKVKDDIKHQIKERKSLIRNILEASIIGAYHFERGFSKRSIDRDFIIKDIINKSDSMTNATLKL